MREPSRSVFVVWCIGAACLSAQFGCRVSTPVAEPTLSGVEEEGAVPVGFEYMAIQVNHPWEMANWYCDLLGFRVVREQPAEGALWMSDAQGVLTLKLYAGGTQPGPSYATLAHRASHLSFSVEDLPALRDKLILEGARPIGQIVQTAEGLMRINLRDPWGTPIQFVERPFR